MGWVLKLNASSSGCCEERIGDMVAKQKSQKIAPFWGGFAPMGWHVVCRTPCSSS